MNLGILKNGEDAAIKEKTSITVLREVSGIEGGTSR